jgi:hypothetical protein
MSHCRVSYMLQTTKTHLEFWELGATSPGLLCVLQQTRAL